MRFKPKMLIPVLAIAGIALIFYALRKSTKRMNGRGKPTGWKVVTVAGIEMRPVLETRPLTDRRWGPSEERRHPYPGQILATPRYHMDLVLAFRWNESAVRRANAEIKQRYETLPGGLASTPALLAANAERARKEAKQAKQAKQRTSTGTTAGARALGRIAAAQMDKEGKIMDAAGGRGAPGWRMKHKGGIVAGVLAAAVVVAALTMKSSSAPPKVDEKPQEEATGEPPESIANTPSSAEVADGEDTEAPVGSSAGGGAAAEPDGGVQMGTEVFHEMFTHAGLRATWAQTTTPTSGTTQSRMLPHDLLEHPAHLVRLPPERDEAGVVEQMNVGPPPDPSAAALRRPVLQS